MKLTVASPAQHPATAHASRPVRHSQRHRCLPGGRTADVEFLKGEIEALPMPDVAVDVVISNCVINLSTGKPAVLAEMFRVLVPGGRIGITDVAAEDHLTPPDRAAGGRMSAVLLVPCPGPGTWPALAAAGSDPPPVM